MNTASDPRAADEHGPEKEFAVIVNGRPKTFRSRDITFAQVVALAFDNPPTGDNIMFTVTYRKGDNNKPEGTMVDGDTVKLKDGIIFNVTATDKS